MSEKTKHEVKTISLQAKTFNGYTVTESGKVYRPNGTEVTGSKIGKNGHVIMTLGGQTIYLARLVYCLFNSLDYDAFCGRIRYYGSYEDCSLKNIFVVSKPERKALKPKRVIDPWEIRTLFCSGLALAEISSMLHISQSRIKFICQGFEGCGMDEIMYIIKIAGTTPSDKF
jgi:hypothetical protein